MERSASAPSATSGPTTDFGAALRTRFGRGSFVRRVARAVVSVGRMPRGRRLAAAGARRAAAFVLAPRSAGVIHQGRRLGPTSTTPTSLDPKRLRNSPVRRALSTEVDPVRATITMASAWVRSGEASPASSRGAVSMTRTSPHPWMMRSTTDILAPERSFPGFANVPPLGTMVT